MSSLISTAQLLLASFCVASLVGCITVAHAEPTASTASTYPTFESRDTFLAYVERTGTRFLDLGASLGGSRQRLPGYVRRAESSATPSAVLGLDISDKKLRACNADGKVNCAKADLQKIFKKGAAPVVEGAQMVDILEHINMPVPAARAAAIPPRPAGAPCMERASILRGTRRPYTCGGRHALRRQVSANHSL